MKIKRYDIEICHCSEGCHADMSESEDGNYVSYDDMIEHFTKFLEAMKTDMNLLVNEFKGLK